MPEPIEPNPKKVNPAERQAKASEKQAKASEKQATASEKQATASKSQASSSERQAASSEELDVAQQEVVDLLNRNHFLLKLMTAVIVICLAVISVAGIIGARTGADAKAISQQNNRFLENFSNYMRCLIVNEDEVVVAIGEEAYLNLCDELLFHGTGQKPHVIKATIPTTTTTSP